MLSLDRHHDFQVFVSPKNQQPSAVNPPRFNWPQEKYEYTYSIDLEHVEKQLQWRWVNVSSPFQLPFLLSSGEYRWRVTDINNQVSEWLTFSVSDDTENYLPPTAQELFELCHGKDQFLMYFDEDISKVCNASQAALSKLQNTAALADINAITYPTHYRRGEEEGKRTAIANVRNWIDRDLMALTLLYKIWGKEESGRQAVSLLLRLAEWSPEGPASLLRPCTWGDEVGLSLSRNLYLAYHWLSPLLTDSEKDFIRPMLIRMAYQMEERLEQDMFKQYPGHSHTSRLPAYLGIAALALHKEFERDVCTRWLEYSLMIYRSVLPFYGGEDGSWAEGAFYSSSYSKWQHPFFLTVERISGFSFYNHPFYKNYHQFAMDFVASDEDIHPFGDGFWCKRDNSVEWPGFFAQNPLRIYADRFGNKISRDMCKALEVNIDTYELHLLDVIPTIKQIECLNNPPATTTSNETAADSLYSKFYNFAGFGNVKWKESSLYFRASQFGNSSHRHADQGNITLIDSGDNVLTPSGSYGYRFGSGHHSEWTRTTKAHNLPLIGGIGQILDDESATASVIRSQSGNNWYLAQIDLSKAYRDVVSFIRTIVFVADKGLMVCDKIQLEEAKPIQWRLHSPLAAEKTSNYISLTGYENTYTISLANHKNVSPTLAFGYDNDPSHSEAVISDASEDINHIEWELAKQEEHLILGCCEKRPFLFTIEDNRTINVFIEQEKIEIDLSAKSQIIVSNK
ncbi:heparinase II/III domain-containing protein [Photobacterium minamisatsumaniensis]|uniref:heparinase II/III domain-containing protein n=1 Tax=Photobacterium minamisatsumaniensis TaxID=2910233 RepID=UPI003D1447C0